MATPVLHAAARHPGVERLTILLRGHLAPLLSGGELEPFVRGLGEGESEAALYRELAPDGVLLLTNSFGAARRARAGGVPVRAGAALSGRRWMLTRALVPPRIDGRRVPVPTARLHADLAGLVGLEVPDLHPRLDVPADAAASLGRVLEGLELAAGAGYVACAPGAAFGAAKLWPPEHFAAALDALFEQRGLPGLLFGAPAESAILAAVAEHCEHPVRVVPETERSLGRSSALVAGAQLLLVGDSGPRWLAAAFDVPCVSVMGPNFPELTATSLEHARIVRHAGLDCAPCLERCCPLGHHRCMRELPVAAVLDAASELLGPCGVRA